MTLVKKFSDKLKLKTSANHQAFARINCHVQKTHLETACAKYGRYVRFLRSLLKLEKEKYQHSDYAPLSTPKTHFQARSFFRRMKEKQGKENLGQKRLSGNTKVNFAATYLDHSKR